MRQLSPFDAQFLAIENGNMMCHYCGLGVFEPHPERGPLTVAQVRDHVAGRLDAIPPLRWHLRNAPFGIDHPSWVDGPVDLEQHVLGSTADTPGGPRELARAAAAIMAGRLDRSRPLWELHVIDGLAGSQVAVGFKFHHAAADALAAATIMSLLMDTEADGERELSPTPQTGAVGHGRTLARSTVRAATHPLTAAKAASSALPHLDQIPMMRTLPGARTISGAARSAKRAAGRGVSDPGEFIDAPKMRFNGPLSPRRSVAYGTVPVADVRAVKDHHGVSFNDIVMAAIGGGLRRRLLADHELPADPLLAFVPVNIRTDAEDPYAGNAISSFVVPVPTHADSAQDRVRLAHEGMTAAKVRGKLAPPTLMRDANALIPPAVFGRFAGGIIGLLGAGRVAPPLNLTISNVPGPTTRLHLAGAPMASIAPFSLVFGGVALNVTVVSYAGDLQIGVVGDAELVPDAWELVADIEAEFADLAAAV